MSYPSDLTHILGIPHNIPALVGMGIHFGDKSECIPFFPSNHRSEVFVSHIHTVMLKNTEGA